MYDFVKKHGVILEKTDNSFENEGVFNPAAIREGNNVHLFYRAVRTGNFSTIGYCKLDGPLKVVERSDIPILSPENSQEFQGLEDPRITKIDDTYYLTYAIYDGINVFGAYAISKDLITFERKGIITPKFNFDEYAKLIRQNINKISDKHLLFYELFESHHLSNVMKADVFVWDKNIVFFPRKINGKYAFLHRLFPTIQIVFFKKQQDLNRDFWIDYITHLSDHIVLRASYQHERSHIGAGCPPIETKDGWLLIYHAAEITANGRIYNAAAALLDLEDPRKVIAQLKKPLICPTEEWEKKGVVNNVVFPTGSALFDDELYIYYGAADSRIAVASMNINTLLTELKLSGL
ncbi:putative GH43/DUF377 family glycosyl hydrolase [Gillisia mitskevichiae]|uniref:Putative GH43/DUF377 family glycosyl hydrolase n=1 Tax=Gillisia mitskevichiae TaxID=270921 RepID=A0A495PV47_9FLAO|nr:pesticidal protein Cry7Aa [Gillisia mitskevichiae]RKS53650.1 putative GH43/DUF377 family glycosyl hydrolase [Gillisia mitskevichiae]